MISVEVVTPERVVHTTQGAEVLLPTINGTLGIRSGHLPLIAPLKAGQVVVKQENGEEEVYAVAGGFVEVLPNAVRIMADSAERAEELDELVVKDAIDRAERAKLEATEKHEFADAAAGLEANLARLKAVQRKKARNHRGPRLG